MSPECAGKGIGIRIIDGLLEWLEVDRPHFTIGDHRYPAFEKIFDAYDWRQTAQANGLYVPNKRELLFNGSEKHVREVPGSNGKFKASENGLPKL